MAVKTEVFPVLFSVTEKRALAELAARDGVSMGELVRRLVGQYAEQQYAEAQ